jgi:hypothetical protein
MANRKTKIKEAGPTISDALLRLVRLLARQAAQEAVEAPTRVRASEIPDNAEARR